MKEAAVAVFTCCFHVDYTFLKHNNVLNGETGAKKSDCGLKF